MAGVYIRGHTKVARNLGAGKVMRYFFIVVSLLLLQAQRIHGKEAAASVKTRNPFYLASELEVKVVKRPENKRPIDVNNLKLLGTFLSADDRIALINDEILREGDSIDNKKIVAIKDDSVLLEEDSMSALISLPKLVEGMDNEMEK